MKNRKDLRVIKTRANLKNSLIRLLQKKTINEISVTEICDDAQCSRNTFYMHYPYKENLYEELIDESIMRVQQGFSPLSKKQTESEHQYIERAVHNILSSMYKERDMLMTLIKKDNTNTFCCRLTSAICDALIEASASISDMVAHTDTYRLIAKYCSGGIVNFILCCFQDINISLEDAEKMLVTLHTGPFQVGIDFLNGHSKN